MAFVADEERCSQLVTFSFRELARYTCGENLIGFIAGKGKQYHHCYWGYCKAAWDT